MNGQSVTVNILGRNYRLTISPEDVATLHKAAETINAQARAYGQQYSYNDNQDLLSMVALSKVTELLKMQANSKNSDTELMQRLQNLDAALETHLHPALTSL